MFIIYSKPQCSFCDQAKALLTQNKLPYIELVLGKGYTLEQLLLKVPNAKTVPQIFESKNNVETHIGGFAQLKDHLNLVI